MSVIEQKLTERQVVVLGGGLAGIAAAVRLAQEHVPVTLVETSRRLGGRATSHVDKATGQRVDNCQHVLLGCCTNLIDLYKRLGVAGKINWADVLHFYDKQGHHDQMVASDLPAPLHLSESLMRFGTLTLSQKMQIARAMLAMMRLGPEGRERFAEITFEQWLREHGQSDQAIQRFWEVIVVSALNQTPRRCSAAYAMQVFQEGFLAHRDAYRMGTAAVPLGELYDTAEHVIETSGGRVMHGASVQRIMYDGKSVTGVQLADEQTLTADAYISALPFDRLDKAADESLHEADERFVGVKQFEHSPILGIHMWYAKPVLDGPHMIFVDSPLQWVFNKGLDADGSQYLHGVISAADVWIDHSAEDILAMAHRELSAYLPAAELQGLARGKVIKEKRATFNPAPGVDAHRPTTCGAVGNLFLAGDWTATGWPATMEGAARSGYMAAAAAMGRPAVPAVADLPTAPLVSWVNRLFGPRV